MEHGDYPSMPSGIVVECIIVNTRCKGYTPFPYNFFAYPRIEILELPAPPNGLRISGAEGVRCMRVLTRFANSHTKCNTAKRPPAAL